MPAIHSYPPNSSNKSRHLVVLIYPTRQFPLRGFIGFSNLGCEAGNVSLVSIPELRPLRCTIPQWCHPCGIQCEWYLRFPRVLQSSKTATCRIGNWSSERLSELSEVTQQRRKRFWSPSQFITPAILCFPLYCVAFITVHSWRLWQGQTSPPRYPKASYRMEGLALRMWPCHRPRETEGESSLCHNGPSVWLWMCYARDIILWKESNCTSKETTLWRQRAVLPHHMTGSHEYSRPSAPKKNPLHLPPVLSSYHNLVYANRHTAVLKKESEFEKSDRNSYSSAAIGRHTKWEWLPRTR